MRSALVALLGLVLVGCAKKPVVQHPLEASVWYWHSPFDGIEDLGIKQIFVRAATITCEDGHLLVPRIQDFREAPKVPTTLVINLEGSVVSQLATLSDDVIAEKLAEVYHSVRAKVSAKGGRVLGLQVDFDCPTSKLGRYESILARTGKLIRPDVLSITALPTWLGSREFDSLAKEVAYFVPQFYEGRLGSTLDDPGSISDLEGLRNGLERADQVGVPYWAGLAAYGHAALYDDKGHLVGTYKELAPSEALRHPDLRLEDAYPAGPDMKPVTQRDWIGEDVLRFRAIRPDSRGRGLGSTILYKIPSGTLLSKQIAIVKKHQSENLRGFIAFRYPQPGEQLALPVPTLRAALHDEPLECKLEVSSELSNRPFGLIEKPASAKPERALTIRIKNAGNEATWTGLGAVMVDVASPTPGIEVSDRIPFPVRLTDSSGLRASKARATNAEFQIARIGPGETVRLGPIFIKGETGEPTVTLRWKDPGGFAVHEWPTAIP